MRVELKRVSRAQVGIRKGAGPSGSWWAAMEISGFPEGDLTLADDVATHWDTVTDDVVVTYRVPSVLPIRGAANPVNPGAPVIGPWPWELGQ
jgi:hypothetical protein